MLKEHIQRYRHKDIASRGLHWLWANQDHFRITNVNHISDVALRAKPLLELSFLLPVLRKNNVQHQLLDDLQQLCTDAIDGLEWHQVLAFDPSNVACATLLHPLCTAAKCTPPYERDYFDALARRRFFDSMDRVPFRQMDLAHGLAAMGKRTCEADMLLWFSNTAFGRHQPLTRYSIGDLYSLTHAIFYLTELGTHPEMPLVSPETRLRMHDELIRLAAIMVRGDHLDVLSELLLCCVLCDVPLSGQRRLLFTTALTFVQNNVRKDGTLPPSLLHGPRRNDAADTFAYLYHTCLVSVFLFSLLAKEGYAN